ncbi:MAG: hypothetical protein HYZ75_13590 [Elusimicrobia bacterium]|nr:hypothetical protein [Elusimicrobiota bacterium]
MGSLSRSAAVFLVLLFAAHALPARADDLSDEAERLRRYEAFLERNAAALERSARFAGLKQEGLLDGAQTKDGPPPALTFSMTINGRTADLQLSLAHGDLAEQLSVLSTEGKPLPLKLDGNGTLKTQIDRASAQGPTAPNDLKDAVAGAGRSAADLAGRLRPVDPGALPPGGRLPAGQGGAQPPQSSSPEYVEWSNGRREWFRNEMREGKLVKVPIARETPHGIQFLEGSAGYEPDVERFSRAWNGQRVLMRFEDGMPSVSHIQRKGEWVPLAAITDLRPGALKGQLVQNGFAFDLGADGRGVRTHQSLRVGNGDYWVALAENRPISTPDGTTRQVLRVGGRNALVEFASDGSARATHFGAGGTLQAATAGDTRAVVRPIGGIVHQLRSADGKMDSLAYQFTRQEDGTLTGRAYAQRLRDAAGTWAAVDGRPIDRSEGTSLQLLQSPDRREKLLVRFRTDGAPEVLAAGANGRLLGADYSKVRSAAFSAQSGDFRFSFDRRPGEQGFAPRLTAQSVDVGLGMKGWAPLEDGSRLTPRTLPAAVAAARAAKIAELAGQVRRGEADAAARLRHGLSWYKSNPAVASRVAGILAQGRPAPITAAQVFAAAHTGTDTTLSFLGGARGEVLHRTRAEGAREEPAARGLVLVVGAEADAERHQALLADYRTALKGWAGEGDLLTRVGRGATLLTMLPTEATLVMASAPQLQQNLDLRVNPGLAQAPLVAAGIGISRDPARAREGANRLNPNVRAIFGGGGGLIGRRRNVPGQAAAQIAANARGSLPTATAQMAAAREQTLELVAAGLQQKRLETIARTEESFAKQGIPAVDVVSVADARAQVGFSYQLADGGSYLLRLDMNAAALPREENPPAIPATLQVAAAVDGWLSQVALSRPVTGADVDAAWEAALVSRYGVDPAEARRIRAAL